MFNSADRGGGVYMQAAASGGTATFTSSTISGNVAADIGGGLFNAGGTMVVHHSTITENQAAGIAGVGEASVQIGLLSTIVAGNISSDVEYVTGSVNPFVSEGNNLLGSGNATDAFSAALQDIVGANTPQLAPLSRNGGGTLTHPLLPDSLAVDTGANPNSLPYDQRGATFQRVFGAAADIGAFELQKLELIVGTSPRRNGWRRRSRPTFA